MNNTGLFWSGFKENANFGTVLEQNAYQSTSEGLKSFWKYNLKVAVSKLFMSFLYAEYVSKKSLGWNPRGD